jgi:hypothetical protein
MRMPFSIRCNNCGKRAHLPFARGNHLANCHLAFDDAGDPVLGCALNAADGVTRNLVARFFFEWSQRPAASSDRLLNEFLRRGPEEPESCGSRQGKKLTPLQVSVKYR